MSPAVDMFARTEQFYYDSKTRCQIENRLPGGGGINVARNLKRFGLPVTALFPAGGHHGDLLEQLLQDQSLSYLRIPIKNETTQNIVLSESATGQNLHLVFPGAQLAESEWQACSDAIMSLSPRPAMLIISGSLPGGVPEHFTGQLIRCCHAVGIKVILDTSGPALLHALGSGVFAAKLNREDFTALGYEGANDIASRAKALKTMCEHYQLEHLVLTLGPDGALLASRTGELLHARPPQVTVISHAGAGDAFVSVMSGKLFEQRPIREAFVYGVAAAAAAISTPGNQLEDLAWLEAVYKNVSVVDIY